jgi:glycosyltransferase involved in cell wall biosynthesis
MVFCLSSWKCILLFIITIMIDFISVTLTIRKLEQEILAAGHFVCILTTNSGDPKNTHIDGEHPHRQVIFMDNTMVIPFLKDPHNPDISYQIGFALSKAVKQQLEHFEPTIIHITVPDCTCLHLIEYARKKEIPLMGTYHSNIPDYMDHYPGMAWLKPILANLFRHQYNFLQKLYVPTPYIRQHLIQQYQMDRVTNLKIWGRGVDTDKFHPNRRSMSYRRQIGIPDDAVVVLWVGRLVPEKRPDIFVQVIQRLQEQNKHNVHALVVGAGPIEDEIKKALSQGATFTGWMNADQLSVAYASSDIFLFPSSVETFGNVTLEAAASGLPVVVEADCSGHLVREGENGFACRSGVVDSFYQAILALVKNKRMRQEFSASSRDMALTLEKGAVVRQMLDNYQKVTDEFYAEYSGRHANRDYVYTRPDSFVAGRYPRPLIMSSTEKVFVFVFQLVSSLFTVYHFLRNLFFKSPMQTMKSSSKTVVSFSHAPLPTNRKRKDGPKIIEYHRSDSSFSVVELGSGGDAVASAATDFDLGKNISADPLLSFDDATAASSSSSTFEESSAQSSSTRRHVSIGDGRISIALAKAFARTVFFHCRMESNLRDNLSRCCSPSNNKFVGAAKRKNSSMVMSMSDSSDTDSVPRGRSDASESLLVDELSSPTGSSGCGSFDRIVRRGPSTVIDVY